VRNWRGAVEQWFARLSRAKGGVFFVFTGTAANVLGLSLLRPFEAVICAESAHLASRAGRAGQRTEKA
jgi:threonine aldolase